ncbi:hypothetical protein BKA66DRAFT_479139 [Pyrenochaeta sp. MPI-SDFR-AT-0127]|nr:hypothetical protein BKA66DRAFT_479139 [Pyrenochaeta sp. MPI-SDFR-AT-0127]
MATAAASTLRHARPLSPTASHSSTASFESSTQPAQPAFGAPDHGLPQSLIDKWDAEYNRRAIPLVPRRDLEALIASIVHEPGSCSEAKVAARLQERLHQRTEDLETRLEDAKEVFLDPKIAPEVDALLPYAQQTTVHSHAQYLIRTLSLFRQLYAERSEPNAHVARPNPPAGRGSPDSPPSTSSERSTKSRRRGARSARKKKEQPNTSVRRSGRVSSRVRKSSQE